MKLVPDKKMAGVLCPVFAMRTADDLGIGDTTAVKEMIAWCHQHGLGLLQLLPINETGPDNSPYNAISAMALEPTTIATTPAALPDLLPADFDRLVTGETRTALRSGPVRYRQVKALKRELLWAAFQRAGQRKVVADFAKTNPWLPDYTLYRALLDENGGNDNWESWQAEHQAPDSVPKALLEKLAECRQVYAYGQWGAHEQWRDVRRFAETQGVALMGDIPFGVSRYSADVWGNRELFDLTWSGGAPPEPMFKPDEFTAKWGQNWGIPLYRWDEHKKHKFAWWHRRVQQTSAIFHLFRIDHVLGFYRVFAFPWRPQENWQFTDLDEAQAAKRTNGRLPRFFPFADDTPAHQQANCRHGEALLAMIREAAGETVVVAEDLGVVPEYVRPNLAKLGIPGFKIPYWERNPDYTFVAGKEYPRLSIVTPATHDHEPLAAYFRQLWNSHEAARAKQDHHNAYITWLELQRFMQWAGGDENNVPREFTPALHEAFCRQVLASNSWLAIFMITDVFAQEMRFNVPGPISESNWTERLATTVNGLDKEKSARFLRLIREVQR
ncbi:MAG: 4-alpha-glucanotransferase [Verrucomicrobiota bacterium]